MGVLSRSRLFVRPRRPSCPRRLRLRLSCNFSICVDKATSWLWRSATDAIGVVMAVARKAWGLPAVVRMGESFSRTQVVTCWNVWVLGLGYLSSKVSNVRAMWWCPCTDFRNNLTRRYSSIGKPALSLIKMYRVRRETCFSNPYTLSRGVRRWSSNASSATASTLANLALTSVMIWRMVRKVKPCGGGPKVADRVGPKLSTMLRFSTVLASCQIWWCSLAYLATAIGFPVIPIMIGT